ncbi:MAG: Chemotaxis protein methyltransferase CheR [bacterium]|nr:Chemotaxis protein methyltransferase CheR [bacterium]
MGEAIERSPHSGLHLGKAVAVVTASLTLLVILSGAVLLVISAGGRAGVRERETVIDQIRTAESVRVALLHFALDSDLAYLTKERGDESKRLDSEASVMAALAQERRRPLDVEQRRAFADAEDKIKTYLLTRRDAEAKGPAIRQVLLASSAPLNAALGAARRVVDLASQRLVRYDDAARSRMRARDTIGTIANAIVLIGFLGALVGLRRLVIQPLLCIGHAIHRFAGGDRLARAAERGPAEFQATARKFNQMVDHMVQQEEQRLAFLAGVAHDLRNPLAAMRMATHLLSAVPLPSEDKVRNTLALLDRQVTRLDRMVADFLDASRIESGHLELRLANHDLRPLAEEAVELYASSSYSHQLTLRSPDEEVTVRCDPTRVEQVLNNLISNAIKYSPAGGPVIVTVARDGGFASIDVADRGIGIAQDELEEVFSPFCRTGASRETIPGVGLGLWVSRRIVEAHGGALEVLSKLGVGSTFRVRLPLAPRAEAGEPAQHPAVLH